MLHARNDYNARIQDGACIIPADEPVFLLRGQDKFAPIIMDIWCLLVENEPVHDKNLLRCAQEHAEVMRNWQKKTGKVKSPDMHEEDGVY